MQNKNWVKILQLIGEQDRKINQHTDAFLQRADALNHGDTEQAEYIDKMLLEPIAKQIEYLSERILKYAK
ncbi:hypothetical protein COW99_03790 [Candidatus Roizmanbacteria bacterium CG22_combo_CG10-13_8_21_14_all_38_20]|uniref:DUF86 domain-containing protein n=1 Tax=Candidatus Roizmanbacteria bacterium CG22_combo_CG10-13_8_21_14_all_38_20 TaxID=1974862 RepID=A0A2H0BV10_9BACT|nr:hypothetical protein [Candidatus Microgenomates bacterium]PIP61513.1 MAG: hypothetical protein COW99_03790 [Candidatus Roizmanbacteria bacterium CG22_combo_CG10-13_8_21_14_all_38_20]PJC32279.1 MAG: hypothetical protein CO050_00465 [Candidatus Roizmanbacteria bacterium CG_4_9_14_0_2_um_filter_38_17]